MNMQAIEKIINVVFHKTQPQTLEQRFGDVLDIHLEPYAEINDQVEKVLQAIVDHSKFVDEHDLRGGEKENPFRAYALFKPDNQLYICPVHSTLPCCLNPLSVTKTGKIKLSRWSVGSPVYKAELEKLVKEGYLVGYVLVK